MLTVCPTCKTSIGLKQAPPAAGAKIRCSNCRAIFRLVPKKNLLPAAHSTYDSSPITVVVASDDPQFSPAIGIILGAGFRLVPCHDGPSALAAVERLKPHLALIDVALPVLFGFQVCEAIRRNPGLASVKLIITTSTYDTRRYVRTPGSLYGADALIEKHRIPAALKELVEGLIPSRVQAPASDVTLPPVMVPPVTEDSTATEVEAKGAGKITDDAVPLDHKKAQRLARLIVSDIALYNKSLVEAGVRNGTFFKVLDDDIREGRALYERRVAEEIRNCTSYLDDAFADLIRRKEKELASV